MQMKEISVTVALTIPVQGAQYHVLRPEVTLTGVLEDGDDVEESYEALSKKATGLFFRNLDSLSYHMGNIQRIGVEEACQLHLGKMFARKFWVLMSDGRKVCLSPTEVQSLIDAGTTDIHLAVDGESEWRTPDYYGLEAKM